LQESITQNISPFVASDGGFVGGSRSRAGKSKITKKDRERSEERLRREVMGKRGQEQQEE
jgi:hypothetical protein